MQWNRYAPSLNLAVNIAMTHAMMHTPRYPAFDESRGEHRACIATGVNIARLGIWRDSSGESELRGRNE